MARPAWPQGLSRPGGANSALHRWVRPKRLQPRGFIIPCQPTLASKVPAGDGWIHELKHDGFRILAFRDGDWVRAALY
jgi:ATP-dependent DNA ligase